MKLAILAVSLGTAAAVGAFAVLADAQTPPPQPAGAILAEMQQRTSLRPVSAFNTITDRSARSVALFEEAGKVITHPRCANCHPVSTPAQGDDRHPHMPKVANGPSSLQCSTCHTAKNVWVGGVHIVSVPGNPKWMLAPPEMAWQGKSLGDICRQIKDPSRNGGKTLAEIHEHMASDVLVAWGWDPGAGRVAVPGTQAQFGQIIQAWIDTGAVCPAGGVIVPTHEAKAPAPTS